MIHLNPKYKPLFNSDSRYYIVTGGRGSGKSHSVAAFVLLLSYERDQVILFTRYTMVSAHISIIPEFKEKVEMYGLENDFTITNNTIYNNVSGSRIVFKGLKTGSGDNTAALKSINGLSTWVNDESEELNKEELFDKINLSIRSQKAFNRVISILNPTTKEHFFYTRFFLEKGVPTGSNIVKGDTTYIHTSYLDNIKHLPDSFIQEAEKMRTNNPDKYEHIMMGGWLDKAEGVVYRGWITDEYKPQGVEVFGLDFGFSIDPTALVRISINKRDRKIYLKEELYNTHLGTSDLQIVLKDKVGRGLIYADSAEARLISDLRRAGLNIIPTQKGAGSVLEGIKQVQDYTLVVDPSSINLIKELNNYTWKEKGLLPIDAYNHLLDALRYGVSMSTKGVVEKYTVG